MSSPQNPVSHSPARAAKALKPRDAATLILCDRSGGKVRVLMGKRSPRQKFMPGLFVFPGGAVEPADRRMNVAGPLDEAVERKLLVRANGTSPDYARGLALAAIRETFEETGLALGVSDVGAPESTPNAEWKRFAETGVFPTLDGLDFLARAITPPGRPRRFDARFFVADASLIAREVKGVVGPDAELVELDWKTLEEAKALDLPNITRQVLDDLQALAADGADRLRPRPLYRRLYGKYLREML
jgi:8-oxo-dGTP pyrophosphatase MutT (NUDIX family)